ncbi:MAG TPA: acyl carrier protein [Vicinamibacterales bacterium]|jgi:acyl carrier protein
MSELDPIEQKVIELIAQKKRIPPESISLDSTFLELGIDSLDGMDLLFNFEESFKLTIPDEMAQQMKSVRQVADALRTALANSPRSTTT